MIRAVFDTNVLVSTLTASRGTMLLLRSSWLTGQFQLVYSDYLLGELRRVWGTSYWTSRVPPGLSQEFVDLLRERGQWIEPHVEVVGNATHQGDDPVLATAASVNADRPVTGDAGLLKLGVYEGVSVATARRFVELLAAR